MQCETSSIVSCLVLVGGGGGGVRTPPTRNFTSEKVIFSKSNQVFWLTFASLGAFSPSLAKVSQNIWFDLEKITFSEVKFLVGVGFEPTTLQSLGNLQLFQYSLENNWIDPKLIEYHNMIF